MRNQDQLREELFAFLNTVARPGSQVDGVDDGVNLIDAGLIDSFALIQVILYLEQEHDLDIQALGIDPSDLGTISGIVAAITRSGE
jgi:acyl carrier protein